MFRKWREELARQAAEKERQQAQERKEASYMNAAWVAEQSGRSRTAKETLIELTLFRLRKRFEARTFNTTSLLSAKTSSGVYERDKVRFTQRLKGKLVHDALFSSSVRFHTRLLDDEVFIGGMTEALKINSLADHFGLKASYMYANPENFTDEIESSNMTNGPNGAPVIHLDIRRSETTPPLLWGRSFGG